MRDIETLYKKYDTVVVVAAGPTAPDDIEKLSQIINIKDKHTAIVGINHHADYQLIETDFNCFLDVPKGNTPEQFIEMALTPGKRISILDEYTDYKVPYRLTWVEKGETAMMSVWFATYITDGNVYLCGFDCWQSTKKSHFYKDRPEERKRLNGNPERQKRRWRELFFRCEDPKRIIPMSGILTELK